MPSVLTCECGAHFETDDLSVQEILCPQCQQLLSLLTHAVPARRTCLFSLFSLVLALVGFFTLIGSVLALLCGLTALVSIARRPRQLQGIASALVGIALATAGLGTTWYFLRNAAADRVGAWLREQLLAPLIDHQAVWPAKTNDGKCLLSRPSPHWARLRGNRGMDAAVAQLQHNREVLLVHLHHRLFADLSTAIGTSPGEGQFFEAGELAGLHLVRPSLVQDPSNEAFGWIGRFGRDGEPPFEPPVPQSHRKLPALENYSGREWLFDLPLGGQPWRVLVQFYHLSGRRPQQTVYVARVYAPLPLFVRYESELRQVLASLQFVP